MRTVILILLICLLFAVGVALFVESPVVDPPAVESPVVESPVVESPVVEPPAVKPPAADPPAPCGPEFQALFDTAVVELRGSGDRDVMVVTDPLCWHCRLGHKVLREYPELYRSVKLSFFPRRSNIGSDMAAWILEDAASDERLPELIDFAYKDLKGAKTDDLEEARMIMLIQFTEKFPWLLEGTTEPELFVRLKAEHEAHVLKEAELARAVHFPGTPILIVGKAVVVGYAPDPWIKTIKEAPVCE